MNDSIKKRLTTGLASLFLVVLAACEGESSSSSSSNGVTGIAGSTARMVIVNDYLYAIANNQIQLFNISTPAAPNPWARVTVDWDIQTLYPYEQYLLVGAADGVHILDNSDEASPQYISDFRHGSAIDPVVAANGYAYVTLKRDRTLLNSVDDQMNVIDISNVFDPQLKKVLPMQGPEGLSVDGQRLFVCDGAAGLKQFDLAEPENPTVVDVLPDVDCNDVIAFNGTLYVITDNSLQQYDYTVSPPQQLSIIETDVMSSDALEQALSAVIDQHQGIRF